MSEQIPEEATFPKEIYAAAGELIITWAGVESALSLLVARLIASHIDRKTLQPTFDWVVYVKVGFVTHGTSPKAALTCCRHILPIIPRTLESWAKKY